jgi:hypothetical protein
MSIWEEVDRGDHAADLDDEHDGSADHVSRTELCECLTDGSVQDRRIEH